MKRGDIFYSTYDSRLHDDDLNTIEMEPLKPKDVLILLQIDKFNGMCKVLTSTGIHGWISTWFLKALQ